MRSRADFENFVFEKADSMKTIELDRRRRFYRRAALTAASLCVITSLSVAVIPEIGSDVREIIYFRIMNIKDSFSEDETNRMYGIAENDAVQATGEENGRDSQQSGNFELFTTSMAESVPMINGDNALTEKNGDALEEVFPPMNGDDDSFAEEDNVDGYDDYDSARSSRTFLKTITYTSEAGKTVAITNEKEVTEICEAVSGLESIDYMSEGRGALIGVMHCIEKYDGSYEEDTSFEIYEECIVATKNVRAGTVADEISGLDEIETYAISENFAAVMRKYADRDFMN